MPEQAHLVCVGEVDTIEQKGDKGGVSIEDKKARNKHV